MTMTKEEVTMQIQEMKRTGRAPTFEELQAWEAPLGGPVTLAKETQYTIEDAMAFIRQLQQRVAELEREREMQKLRTGTGF